MQEAARLIRAVYAEAAPAPDAAGADEGAGGGPGGAAARMADRPVPAAVGVPGRGGRAAPAVAGAPEPLVQPGRLLPAARLRRPAGPFRVEQLWKLIAAPPRAEPGQPVPRLPEGGADYWIMWRRVAGGLNAALQQALYDRLRPALLPGKGKAGVKPGAERAGRDVARRRQPGAARRQAQGGAGRGAAEAAAAQPGADLRLLGADAAGGAGAALRPAQRRGASADGRSAGSTRSSAFEPGNESERLGWAFCLAQLARRTGQRPGRGRQSCGARADALRRHHVPEDWIKMVEEVVELEGEDAADCSANRCRSACACCRRSERITEPEA